MESEAVPSIAHGGHTRREPVIALHPDGSGLAYVAADRSVRWVQRSTGEERTVLPPSENRFEISFSPSGDVMVVVESSACTAHAWPTTNRLWRREGEFSPCKLAWHPDGQQVAIGLEGRNDVLLCHAQTGRMEEYLSGHSVHPRMLQFDREGDRLFSVAWDGLLMAWNSHTGSVEITTAAFPSVLSISADGRRLAFGLSTTEIAVAALEPGAFFHEFVAGESTGRITSDLAVSPDGRWLASTDNFCLRLWDTQSARLAWTAPTHPTEWAAVRFSSDGTSVIQSGVGTEIVRRVLHADPATQAAHLGPPEPVAPGHPGILLFVDSAGDWWVEESQTNQLFCWPRGDASSGRAVFPIKHAERTRFSPDRRYVATTRDDDGHVVINETSTQTPIAELLVGRRAAIAFSPDGRWFVSANKEKYQLWEVGTWRAGPTWPAVVGNHATSSFFYSHDGRLLAARHGEGGLELRETVNYELLLRLEPPAALRAEHMKWSCDGQSIFMLCTGHRLARWDVAAIREELARRGLDW
jgi:WD40 repeat protein